MSKGKVIFVVSSNDKLGTTGKQTGWYLPEAAHPYEVLSKAGYQITFVSPKGGKAPMDEGSGQTFKDDAVCKEFLKHHVTKLDKTVKASELKPADFKGLFYVGGHAPMFDMPAAKDIAKLAADIYENGGILGAVCHGTVGFVPVKLSSGESLVKGQTVTSFTNSEEDAVKLSSAMPFMLETKLRELGAKFVGADNWACNVQVSGRLVSGQNPASATKTGEEMVKLLAAQ
ncbi:uncharacterized protein LOC127868703 [Dreissena polymorpha]|uniref:DJ-1/PfpI domain-containing protein n=1 Tax=Dreissena polymorpha TaxID=45954 RepID=A0A9D4M9L1_DREPO|nr:uncharacterized protein LOC127868703 [Dreissena polymorpha]XP_052266660.1 uncharacterized protein LOC127868703 [Dreissena polymorpha]KAH3872181.1 hypothetical protein DPMN_035396 [Dreissena polymorpha]